MMPGAELHFAVSQMEKLQFTKGSEKVMRVCQQPHNESILQAGNGLHSMPRAYSAGLCSYDQGGHDTGLEVLGKEIPSMLRCQRGHRGRDIEAGDWEGQQGQSTETME